MIINIEYNTNYFMYQISEIHPVGSDNGCSARRDGRSRRREAVAYAGLFRGGRGFDMQKTKILIR